MLLMRKKNYFRVAAFCERIPHFLFFRRMALPLTEAGHEVLFLSNRLSVVLVARRAGYRALLIREEKPVCGLPPFFDGLAQIDGSRTGLAPDDVRRCLWQLETFHAGTLKSLGISAFFFWNGSSLLARALALLARQQGSRRLFFELGNFPGKLLVDPEGVNAKSWFARNYRQLDRKNLDLEAFERWRQGYLRKKLSQHQVQQASLATKFNWYYPLDFFGFYCLSAPYSEPPDIFGRTWRYLVSQGVRYNYDSFIPAEKPGYVFFPLQVSTDSQLLVNSDVDNLQALRLAAEIAQNAGARLVVKPHPAEGDKLLVERLAELRHELGFLFVDGNTFQLMHYSSCVVTINSTAGMEAMLLGKPVTVLGRAMYEKFTIEDLACYINYLIDADYFSGEDLMPCQVSEIIERMQVGLEI